MLTGVSCIQARSVVVDVVVIVIAVECADDTLGQLIVRAGVHYTNTQMFTRASTWHGARMRGKTCHQLVIPM